MARRALQPCNEPGCAALTRSGRCEAHVKRAWHHVKSAAERGYDWKWTKRRNAVMVRDGYQCQTCRRSGFVTQATEVDHIIPRARGGADDYDNLEAICSDCHKLKTQREAKT